MDSPREFPSPFITLIHHPHILSFPSLGTRVCYTLDHMPVALLALVVPLDHEVREVGDERTTEASWTGGEIDELFVLGPFRFGGEDGFLWMREEGREGERVSLGKREGERNDET